MTFELSEDHQAIVDGVQAVCAPFDDVYWRRCEETVRFPSDFHKAMAEGGWLGITMPTEHGGTGLGVTEAMLMMNRVAASGGGMAAASSVHINLFGPHPIVVHGSLEQKRRWIPGLIAGSDQVCFGVTEPDSGLDTSAITTFAHKVPDGYRVKGRKAWTSTAQIANKIMLLARTSPIANACQPTDGMSIFYTDLDRERADVRPIVKMGRAAVDSNMVFFDDYFVPETDLVGEEGRGFSYILDSLNPERILIAAEAIGIGQDALKRATGYARERRVFGRPIGQNQAIQHPLAECWADLEAAWLMTRKAAWLYDRKQPCGAEANAAKFLGARAGYRACETAILTFGGMGYAKEYHVERLFREIMITRIAPISEQLILSFIGEKVLDLPKSY